MTVVGPTSVSAENRQFPSDLSEILIGISEILTRIARFPRSFAKFLCGICFNPSEISKILNDIREVPDRIRQHLEVI